jgi:hypothetical protein
MTKKEYLLYLLSQLLSISGFMLLGFYVYSIYDVGNLEASILNAILITIFFSTAGLVLPSLIFLNKIGGLFYLFKTIGFGFLGLLLGLTFYIILNSMTFGSIPIHISNVILPGILCLCGLLIGSYFGIKKTKRQLDN